MANPVCPRCRSNATAVRAQSPAAGVWIIFGCDTCFYTWRSTEPAANTDPDQYPQVFRLNPTELTKFPEVPAIAPLRPLAFTAPHRPAALASKGLGAASLLMVASLTP